MERLRVEFNYTGREQRTTIDIGIFDPVGFRGWSGSALVEQMRGLGSKRVVKRRAGDWTNVDDRRLRTLVDHAHHLGYWIRFYTLDGFQPADGQGWDDGYNFGSREAVLARWKAALAAGVNFIATDQYEDLATVMKTGK